MKGCREGSTPRPSAITAALTVVAAAVGLVPYALADEPRPGKAGGARPTVALLAGGAPGDLKVLRDTLAKVPGVKFDADGLKFADFGRDGGLFTSFLPIEITDLSKGDVGTIGKAVAAAETSRKEQCPPALFVVLKYRPDSIKTDQLRTALARVKGVTADKSWAGDANLWVGVDGSGQAKLADITAALHAANVKFRDPITDPKE